MRTCSRAIQGSTSTRPVSTFDIPRPYSEGNCPVAINAGTPIKGEFQDKVIVVTGAGEGYFPTVFPPNPADLARSFAMNVSNAGPLALDSSIRAWASRR
jgi:hypothetical protein